MRATAIIMVVAEHSQIRLPLYQLCSVVAVDLFFALSGYLVAQMIAERFDLVRSGQALRTFWVNRWMRTLPLYFVVLAYFVLIFGPHAPVLKYPTGYSGVGALPPLLQFSLFLQDFDNGGRFFLAQYFFGPSWSLCIEEWFYLLCPLVFLLAGRFRQSATLWGCIGIALVVIGIASRWSIYLVGGDHGHWDLDDAYRHVTLLRPDVFVYGAAIYFLKIRGKFAYASRRLIAFAVGLLIIFASLALYAPDHNTFFCKVFLVALMPAASALLIPALQYLPRIPFLVPIASYISTRTYAIYLVHIPIGLTYFTFYPKTIAGYGVVVLVSLAVSELLHRLVERPIMNLRPRYMDTPTAAQFMIAE